MKKDLIYIISWVDVSNDEEVLTGVSGAYNTKELAEEELNNIMEDEKYRCDDIEFSIEKGNDYMKIIFESDYDNYIEYNITEIEINKSATSKSKGEE